MAERNISAGKTEAEPMSIAKPDGFDLDKFKSKRTAWDAGGGQAPRPPKAERSET
jgi:hypothetical protein